MTKKILRIDYDYDISVIGISSSLRDYRLCWYINNNLPLKFHRVDDHLISNEFGEESYHSCFKYNLENTETTLYLLSNKSGSSYILPEIKESDFLLISTESLLDDDLKDLLFMLNKLDPIQTAYSIDPYTLKSKDNLFFF